MNQVVDMLHSSIGRNKVAIFIRPDGQTHAVRLDEDCYGKELVGILSFVVDTLNIPKEDIKWLPALISSLKEHARNHYKTLGLSQ